MPLPALDYLFGEPGFRLFTNNHQSRQLPLYPQTERGHLGWHMHAPPILGPSRHAVPIVEYQCFCTIVASVLAIELTELLTPPVVFVSSTRLHGSSTGAVVPTR